MWGEGCKTLIKKVYQDACRELASPEDELWLYGYSRGAYVIRAVAGLFHHMGCITTASTEDFDRLYSNDLELYPSMQERDKHRGGAIHHRFTSPHTRGAPTIRFLGAFDTVKALDDASLYDISLNPSIQDFRHAVALNERRRDFAPELIFPTGEGIEGSGRTALEAWFLGTHSDIGGGNEQDGLSLYPLQWMLSESRRQGLCLGFRKIHLDVIDDPIEICLPSKQHTWQCRLANGISVEIHDLRIVHSSRKFCSSYGVRLNLSSSAWAVKPREPFERGKQSALKGYIEDGK